VCGEEGRRNAVVSGIVGDSQTMGVYYMEERTAWMAHVTIFCWVVWKSVFVQKVDGK